MFTKNYLEELPDVLIQHIYSYVTYDVQEASKKLKNANLTSKVYTIWYGDIFYPSKRHSRKHKMITIDTISNYLLSHPYDSFSRRSKGFGLDLYTGKTSIDYVMEFFVRSFLKTHTKYVDALDISSSVYDLHDCISHKLSWSIPLYTRFMNMM